MAYSSYPQMGQIHPRIIERNRQYIEYYTLIGKRRTTEIKQSNMNITFPFSLQGMDLSQFQKIPVEQKWRTETAAMTEARKREKRLKDAIGSYSPLRAVSAMYSINQKYKQFPLISNDLTSTLRKQYQSPQTRLNISYKKRACDPRVLADIERARQKRLYETISSDGCLNPFSSGQPVTRLMSSDTRLRMYHKQKKVDPRVEEDIRKAAEKCLRRIPFNLCAINKNYNQIRTTNNLNSAEKRLKKLQRYSPPLNSRVYQDILNAKIRGQTLRSTSSGYVKHDVNRTQPSHKENRNHIKIIESVEPPCEIHEIENNIPSQIYIIEDDISNRIEDIGDDDPIVIEDIITRAQKLREWHHLLCQGSATLENLQNSWRLDYNMPPIQRENRMVELVESRDNTIFFNRITTAIRTARSQLEYPEQYPSALHRSIPSSPNNVSEQSCASSSITSGDRNNNSPNLRRNKKLEPSKLPLRVKQHTDSSENSLKRMAVPSKPTDGRISRNVNLRNDQSVIHGHSTNIPKPVFHKRDYGNRIATISNQQLTYNSVSNRSNDRCPLNQQIIKINKRRQMKKKILYEIKMHQERGKEKLRKIEAKRNHSTSTETRAFYTPINIGLTDFEKKSKHERKQIKDKLATYNKNKTIEAAVNGMIKKETADTIAAESDLWKKNKLSNKGIRLPSKIIKSVSSFSSPSSEELERIENYNSKKFDELKKIGIIRKTVSHQKYVKAKITNDHYKYTPNLSLEKIIAERTAAQCNSRLFGSSTKKPSSKSRSSLTVNSRDYINVLKSSTPVSRQKCKRNLQKEFLEINSSSVKKINESANIEIPEQVINFRTKFNIRNTSNDYKTKLLSIAQRFNDQAMTDREFKNGLANECWRMIPKKSYFNVYTQGDMIYLNTRPVQQYKKKISRFGLHTIIEVNESDRNHHDTEQDLYFKMYELRKQNDENREFFNIEKKLMIADYYDKLKFLNERKQLVNNAIEKYINRSPSNKQERIEWSGSYREKINRLELITDDDSKPGHLFDLLEFVKWNDESTPPRIVISSFLSNPEFYKLILPTFSID